MPVQTLQTLDADFMLTSCERLCKPLCPLPQCQLGWQPFHGSTIGAVPATLPTCHSANWPGSQRAAPGHDRAWYIPTV